MEMDFELIVAAYKNGLEAQESFNRLQEAANQHDFKFIDAAVMAKDANGKITITETSDPRPRDGRTVGAVAGWLLGMLFAPAGLAGAAFGAVLGAAAGAVVGSTVSAAVDSGMEDDYFYTILNQLPPTSSAIMVVVEDKWIPEVMQAVDAYNAQIQQYDVSLKASAVPRKAGK